METAGATITVQVKFGGRTLPLSLSLDSTVGDLKSLLLPLTNVLPRGQKLIFKGKVLTDMMVLKSMQVSDGSKIMLIASHGLHQGDGPITKDANSNIRRSTILDARKTQIDETKTSIEKDRSKRWKLTGVVALSESHLKAVPEDVWHCGPSVRVLDISSNFIKEISAKIASLKSLNKLFLNANELVEDSISWEDLSSLKSLRVLSLSKNHLTTLPSTLGGLTLLTQLHVANNKLTSLPDEIGFLQNLQILNASNNRICSVPSSIANCALIELDLSSNLLIELPESLKDLRELKVLRLSNNGLKTLPSLLFMHCLQLSTLDLHGTQITNEVLRQIEGWEAFDRQRRSKHQKQLDFHVGSAGVFDEGADDDRRS